MKATGIVRRIDDLGRVVIPKEIRRTLRIREGDPLEIYTDSDGEVIFKKYSPVGELSNFAGQYAEVLAKISGLPTIISDRDHIVTAAGVSKREYLERRVTSVIEEFMESRRSYTAQPGDIDAIQPVEGIERSAVIVYPILAAGDVTGCVIMLANEEKSLPREVEIKLAQSAAVFLGKQMEE
ncbi:MAG TPA: AbrB/MazE/SpoVT family DNA-binding domain-containing protein [Clostridiales bacterium]|nr:AbrB/MazE/SpoVT family DNA-binding domain-containing protein [Clostridiales bacterium]